MCGCSESKPADLSNQVKLTINSENTSVPESVSASYGEENKDSFEVLGQVSLSSKKPVFAKVRSYRLNSGSWEPCSEAVTPSEFTALSVFFLVEKTEQRSLIVYEEFQNADTGQTGSVTEHTDLSCSSDMTFELNPSLDGSKSDKTVIAVLAPDIQKADFSEYDQTFRSLSLDGSVIFTIEFEPYTQADL